MSMTKALSNHTPIYHISFYVPDVEEASLKHHKMFGSGPFMIMKDFHNENQIYKGQPFVIDISMSTGWWGDVAVEFVQQNNDGPSYFKDNGRYGFHHVCMGAPDTKQSVLDFNENGCETVMYDYTREDFPYAYIDARELLGMYIEINPGPDPVYKAVKEWAQDWDKETKVLRYMDDLKEFFAKKAEESTK